MLNDNGETRWYAVQTRSNFEKCVTKELTLKAVENYCPAFEESRQWADRKKVIDRPVFPGYVFVRLVDTSAMRLKVLQTFGTVRILGIGEHIEPIPDHEIDWVQKMMTGSRGCCAHPLLREGAWVRVRRGVLKDLEGLLIRIKNQTRLVLSVNLLSRSISTEVDATDVEVIRLNSAAS